MTNNQYVLQDELDEEISIDLKKIFYIFWSRRVLLVKVFVAVLFFFILITFLLPKKYIVEADLYINKSNNSNMAEFNPYFISEMGSTGGMAALMSANGNLSNELELIQSPLVIDKVIRENNLVYKKKFGIFPNKREGEYILTKGFLKKGPKFENKKNTNVITISYKCKKPDLAYNVVNSIINNYIDLHKKLNTDKSKSDREIILKEYLAVKKDLESKVNNASGMPANAITNAGTLTAMSAFSNSASKAIGTIQKQYIEGQKSEIEVREEAVKLAELSKKLEWAKLVEEMSSSSKVIVLREPQKLRDFEYASPKLFINILLGIIMGFFTSLIVLIYKELTDKKLSYSMLSDNINYNLEKDFTDLKIELLANREKTIGLVIFEQIQSNILEKFKEFNNIKLIYADISDEFINNIKDVDEIMLFSKIGKTSSNTYKKIKQILVNMNKKVISDILV